MNMRNMLTVAYFVLAIYMFGGGVMSTLVYYQSWKLVGVEDFSAVHRSVSRRIIPYFVPPSCSALVGQRPVDLVSASSDFHMVDRTHSRGSPNHRRNPPYAVSAHS